MRSDTSFLVPAVGAGGHALILVMVVLAASPIAELIISNEYSDHEYRIVRKTTETNLGLAKESSQRVVKSDPGSHR